MVMNAIEELDAPRPSQMTPRYPPDLERIVMKGLARDRSVRYQTAEEMRIDLEAFARDHQLDVSARNVSSFVRSMISESRSSEPSPGPSAVQREWERAVRRAQTPEPKRVAARPAPVRAGRTISWVALGLVAGAGIGTGWLALRHRQADTRPQESVTPVVGVPSPTAAVPVPPAPKPPATPQEELSDPLPPPMAREPHRDRGSARAPRIPTAPKAAP